MTPELAPRLFNHLPAETGPAELMHKLGELFGTLRPAAPLKLHFDLHTGERLEVCLLPPPGGAPVEDLTPCCREILEAAPEGPALAVARKKLARLAGQTYGSAFHQRVRQLIDAGLLRETGDDRVYHV